MNCLLLDEKVIETLNSITDFGKERASFSLLVSCYLASSRLYAAELDQLPSLLLFILPHQPFECCYSGRGSIATLAQLFAEPIDVPDIIIRTDDRRGIKCILQVSRCCIKFLFLYIRLSLQNLYVAPAYFLISGKPLISLV